MWKGKGIKRKGNENEGGKGMKMKEERKWKGKGMKRKGSEKEVEWKKCMKRKGNEKEREWKGK